MDTLDKIFTGGTGFSQEDYDLIDEADNLIDQTYEYMGIKKVVSTESKSASNIIIKNGRTRQEEISNTK